MAMGRVKHSRKKSAAALKKYQLRAGTTGSRVSGKINIVGRVFRDTQGGYGSSVCLARTSANDTPGSGRNSNDHLSSGRCGYSGKKASPTAALKSALAMLSKKLK